MQNRGGPKLRVLVTGGAGFIGSHTVKALLKAGDEVLVVDNLSKGHVIPEPPAHWLEADIFSGEFEKAYEEFLPEAVIHLAAQIDVTTSWEAPARDLRQNTESTLRILELSRKFGQAKLIYASSAAVYGPASGILTERSPLMPCSPYGLSKRFAEEYIALWGTRWDIPWLILRYSNVYGPYREDENPLGVCRIFSRSLKDKLPILIYGSGQQIRDFISVYDVAQANVLACHSELNGEFLNISSGKGHSILKVLNYFIETSDKTPKIHFLAEGDSGVKYNVLSPERSKTLLKWQAHWTIEEGIRDLWLNT
jgi:UDP-glucose 4-epimerase